MNIAVLVRAYLPIPRPPDMIYAPIDMAAAIAAGLTKRGHKVDFFAPLGSHIPGVRMVDLNLRPLATNQQEFQDLLGDTEKVSHYLPSLWDNYMGNDMIAKAADGTYDLLHFHHPEAALSAARNAARSVPIVYTLHDPIYPWQKEIFELYNFPGQHFTSISDNQRRDAPDLPYAGTIHNGVDIDQFKFFNQAEDYLLCVGRIVPEKGFKEAVQVARQTGNRLLIAGPVYPRYQGYFDQYIKPYLSEKILYLGHIERAQLVRYYQKARTLLTPVQWEEPFGLTTIEAMACGTPVISLRRGAAPEIIQDGKTGYIVDSLAEMAEAIGRVGSIERRACRDHVEQNFSHERMISDYERLFENILRKQRRKYMRNFIRKQIRHTIRRATGGLGRR